MNYYLDENGTLYHHGILGQKWGKRNGPPYPLDASQASASEKRAGFKEPKRKKISDETKKKLIIAGAAIVATGLATYGLYRYSKIKNRPELTVLQGGKFDKLSTINFDYTKGEYETFGVDIDPNGEMIKNLTSLKDITPIFDPPSGKTYAQLTRYERPRCTLAILGTELNARGMNVKLPTLSEFEAYKYSAEGIEKIFKNPHIIDANGSAFNNIEKAKARILNRFKEDSRGFIEIPFGNMAHTFNWEIKNGEVTFFDGQHPENTDKISRYFDLVVDSGIAAFGRLDNLELIEENMDKYLFGK